jgi:membrane protein YqaA with SNARE-associated domain
MIFYARCMKRGKVAGPEKFLFISFLLLMLVAAFYFAFPAFATTLTATAINIQRFALQQGYWGAFIITIISNAALIIPIPYGTVLFLLGSVGLNPWLLGALTGLAAVLGEIVGYWIGRGAGNLFSREYQEKFRRLNNLIIRRPRLIPLLIFFFGVTPLPDDIILIPLGMIKYSFWKTIIPDACGKLIMTTGMALAGKYSLTATQHLLGSDGGFWSSVIVCVLTILIIYLTIKVKWEELIKG